MIVPVLLAYSRHLINTLHRDTRSYLLCVFGHLTSQLLTTAIPSLTPLLISLQTHEAVETLSFTQRAFFAPHLHPLLRINPLTCVLCRLY